MVVAPPAAAASITMPIAIDVIETYFNGIAREIGPERLPSIRIVELRVELVADRPDGVLRHARLLNLLQDRLHRSGVLLLGLGGVPRPRLGGNGHEGAIGPGGHHGCPLVTTAGCRGDTIGGVGACADGSRA